MGGYLPDTVGDLNDGTHEYNILTDPPANNM